MDVSIIIVNYNTLLMTRECIESVKEHTQGVEYEIILVDNASTDGSVELFSHYSDITFIGNKENFGFGKANNIGAKVAKGEYLFLLNSDTLLKDDVVTGFFNYMEEHLDIGACGCNLIHKDGRNAICHGKFPSLIQQFSDIGFSKIYPSYYRNSLSVSQTITEGNIDSVDYISGADIFIRKHLFNEIGGFDESFFMYYEETDLFYRLKESNIRSRLIEKYSIVHLEGGSQQKTFKIERFKRFYKSKVLYYKKRGISVFFMKSFDILFHITHSLNIDVKLMQIFKVIIVTK